MSYVQFLEYFEVTKEVYDRLVSQYDKVEYVKHSEYASQYYYKVYNVTVQRIFNKLDVIEQYYIADINS